MSKTLLEEVVDRGVPFMDAETANEEILKLLRQVGQLESRNAALENGIKAISLECGWRVKGYCDLSCEGRGFCDTSGLRARLLSR
jgi:hypothetical protein